MAARRRAMAAGAAAAMGVALGSCAGPVDRELRPYPDGTPVAEVLNVQVKRDETRITMTNTSARSFGPSTMWINGAYSRAIDGFAAGQTLNLDLGSFRRADGQRFRAGGFFATELPSDLVLAEIETPEGLYGLIVVDGRAF